MHLIASNRKEAGFAIAAAMTAAALYAVFAPLEWTGLIWVALAPLWAVARCVPERQALRLTAWAGFVFWALSLRWLTHVTVLGWLGLSGCCALFMLPSAMVSARWRGGPLGFGVLMAGVWCGAEAFRGWIGGGFPWNTLAAGLTPWRFAVQSAEWIGASGVSAMVAFVNALVAWGLAAAMGAPNRTRSGRAMLEAGTALALVAALLLWGVHRAAQLETEPPARPLRVALIQPSIPQDEKWVESKTKMIYSRLNQLTRQAFQGPWHPDLVVWPETAVPDDVRSSETSHGLMARLCYVGRTPILLGSLDTLISDDGDRSYYNAAILFDSKGALDGIYYKRHLVPMGEYIPLAGRLSLETRLRWGLPPDITPGTDGTLLHIGPNRIPASPLICFEDILPALARRDVRNGARILFNLTNDAWFDDVAAPRQHMRNAVLRAVENRVPLVRCANTGISCFIDRTGRMTRQWVDPQSGSTSAPGVLQGEADVPPDGMPLTFHTRFGDIVGVVCAMVTALWLLAPVLHLRAVRSKAPRVAP